VVIAIIAVLLAVLLPSLTGAKALVKRLQCARKLNGIGRAFNMYVENYDGSLPLLEYWKVSNWNRPYPWLPCIESTYLLSKNTQGSYVHLGCLYGAGFIDDGKVFFCPAVENWYSKPGTTQGNNDGSYLGAVHNSTGKFADRGTGVSQPNQGWKASLGYCYWPLSKQFAQEHGSWTDIDSIRGVSSTAATRYKLGYPVSAAKINELMMTRPIVTDNKFHSTKMSRWLIDCLFPDGHVTYQKQPTKNGRNALGQTQPGMGMHSMNENCQFTGEICDGINIIDEAEKPYNVSPSDITPTEFAFALEP
jgi:type II secretory pathway pseudopilin PulG